MKSHGDIAVKTLESQVLRQGRIIIKRSLMTSLPIYYVPEYEKDSEMYFAKHGTYKSTTPEIIQDFALWVLVNNLDTVTSPAVVVATQMEGVESYMYPIAFDPAKNSSVPEQFDVLNWNGRHVFFIPRDRFLQLEASQTCIQVPGNRWAPHKLRFNILAAFYRISVIPSLSLSVFSREDLYDEYCSKFHTMYHLNGSITYALSHMFNDLYFSLDFFGFADPKSLAEKNSVEAVKKVTTSFAQISTNPPDEFPRLFCFSELRFAISNYHAECFPNRNESPQILSLESYSALQNSVHFVHRTLSNLGFLSDTSPVESLKDAVIQFQTAHGLPPGVCDMFTLRHIWNASLPNGCDLMTLCRLSGMDLPEQSIPRYESTLQPIHVPNPTPEFVAIENALNSVITQIKDRSEAPQWLVDEAKKSLQGQIKRIDQATDDAKKIDLQINQIEDRLQTACTASDNAAAKFDATVKVLQQVQEDNAAMKKEFEEVKKGLAIEKKGNQILLIVIIFMSILVFSKWTKKA